MSPESGTTALQFAFVCPLSAGMHARPASLLTEVTNSFRADFFLTNLRNQNDANAKSVLSIIAADVRKGDHCSVQVSGTDEQAALLAFQRFVHEVLPSCDEPLAQPSSPSSDVLPRVLRAAGAISYGGVSVSPGIARGRVVVVKTLSMPTEIPEQAVTGPGEELARLKLAIAAVREKIRERIARSGGLGSAVLRADLAIANDVLLSQRLRDQVSGGKSAEYAVVESDEYFGGLLRRSGNEYLRDRAADLEEISIQILQELYGTDLQEPITVPLLQEPTILVAENLAPQQLLAFDRTHLRAIVLEHSGAASHTLILARSHGIPAVAGVKNARAVLRSGEEAVVDANHGLVFSPVSSAVERYFEREQRTLTRRDRLRADSLSTIATTRDGKSLEVGANASTPDDIELAIRNSADGIGLFRTEVLFLAQREPPSEEEQFAIYSQAARMCGERPLILRTLDIGGDKPLEYLDLPRGENPFLGYRGARIYEEHSELLQTQLRAILRASLHGRIQIMVPMISSLQEIRDFKAQLSTAGQDLQSQGVALSRDVPIGVMVEVPSAAFILDQLCAEVDFFSIGTNDLVQYFLAVDRGNPKLRDLFDVLHPGFIRMLRQIVHEIHKGGKWVGMCGEMAAELRHLPVLLGLGLDEISVPATMVNELKNSVRQFSAVECSQIVSELINCRDKDDRERLLESANGTPSALALLSEELILLDGDSRTKEEAIQDLVDAFYIAGRAHDRQQLEDAVWAREALYSTGLGFGFATPHCKTEAVTANSIGVLRLRQPINWGTVDHERVRMVILIAMREQQSANGHMQVFSELARKLMNEDFRERLLAIQDAPEMMQYLGTQLAL